MFKTIVLMLLLFTAACSGAATPEPTIAPTATAEADPTEAPTAAVEETDDTAADENTTDTAEADTDMSADDEANDSSAAANENTDTVERPSWQTLELTDARTGESFTLADFEGQTVFVEPMATWCTNCRAQLGRVRQARADLDDSQHVFIALSLETSLQDADLAAYADNQGFNWTFAVMSDELLRALADEFGRGITSAPSTPHFVIRPDGTFTGLSTGSKSVDQIVSEMLQESEV